VIRVTQVHTESAVKRVLLENRDLQDPKDPLVFKDPQDHPAPQVTKDQEAFKDHQDPRVPKVIAV